MMITSNGVVKAVDSEESKAHYDTLTGIGSYKAKIIGSGVKYETLPQAFAAAKEGDTIQLLKDIDVTGNNGGIQCYAPGVTITLDGNGKKITSVADCTLAFFHDSSLDMDNGGTLKVTVKNLTVESDDTVNSGATVQVHAEAVVTLDACKLYSKQRNTNGSVIVQAGGTCIVQGGTEIAPVVGSAIGCHGAGVHVGVYDCTIVADYGFRSESATAVVGVYNRAQITHKLQMFETATGLTLNIMGGHITATATDKAVIVAPNATFTVNIFGGSFEGGNAIYQNAADPAKNMFYPSSTAAETLMPIMADRASICLLTDHAGLVFRTYVPQNLVDHIEKMKDAGTAASYGTLVAPKTYVDGSGTPFTAERLDAALVGTGGYRRLAADDVTTHGAGGLSFTAALTDIPVRDYSLTYAAVGYVEYTMGGRRQCLYTAYNAERHAWDLLSVAAEAPADERDIFENMYHKSPSLTTSEPHLTEVTLGVADNTETVFKTLGRTYKRNDGLACDFTVTGIEFHAYCADSVYVKINSSALTYFTVYIDGIRRADRLAAAAGVSRVKIACDLPAGEHRIELVKQSQFIMSTNEIQDVTLYGEFREKPADQELFIEYYGDSIASGSNVFGGGTSVHTSDGTNAFPWLSAQLLGADCSVVSRGGLPLCGYGSASDIYRISGSMYIEGVAKYDFARIPNAVVVELGINDKVNCPDTTDEIYKAGVKQFVANMQEKYGNDVPIVWLGGYHPTDDYSPMAKEAIDELREAGNTNVHLCMISPCGGSDIYHPNLEKAHIMASEVATHIQQILGL